MNKKYEALAKSIMDNWESYGAGFDMSMIEASPTDRIVFLRSDWDINRVAYGMQFKDREGRVFRKGAKGKKGESALDGWLRVLPDLFEHAPTLKEWMDDEDAGRPE